MQNIVPSSVGAVVVAGIALVIGIFMAVLSTRLKKEPWIKWGSMISFVVFVQGVVAFFQFNLSEGNFNLICEHIQMSNFALLIYGCYKFTISYLGLQHVPRQKQLNLLTAAVLVMIWWPELFVKHEFVHRNFLWLQHPYIEPPLTVFGKVILTCLGVFGLYIIRLWFHKKDTAIVERKLFISGFFFWFIFCLHDLLCAVGLNSIQYLNIYGFLGFLMAVIWIAILRYLDMYTELEATKNNLDIKVVEKTRDLIEGNEKLQIAVNCLEESEKRNAILSGQTEQFSRAVASMLLIEDENRFFDTVCNVIVTYSDYQRVLVSLFKDEPPFRDIIGFSGVDREVVERLRGVEMPAHQYDHVFEKGEKLGSQSYYIPYTMKDILKQEATVYGDGRPTEEKNAWHPEDNLFVKMMNEKKQFIGVISVDESKSGMRPTDDTVRPLEIFSSLISQIILLKKEQQKTRQLEMQLMKATKMESIGKLAGGVAHEFNNILSIIIGNNELIMQDLPEYSISREGAEEIRIAGMRARDVVKQLLTFSRQDDSVKKVMDFRSAVHESMKLIRSSVPANIEIRQDVSHDLFTILGNDTQMNQLLINLCNNAVDAIPHLGGVLTVALSNKIVEERNAGDDSTLKPGRYVRLTVSDNGIGMEKEVLDKVFEPYFTTKQIGRGTGIGLAVVHGIVKRHNGVITADSQPGQGTVFTVLLPAHEGVLDDQGDNQAVPPTGKENVLYVDDEPSLAKLGKRLLESLGYTATSTIDPVEALEMVKTDPDKFDLVISDMAMPSMTGDRLIIDLLKIRPDMPTIICTGYSATISEKEAAKIGIGSFVMKPLNRAEFAITVRKVLDEANA